MWLIEDDGRPSRFHDDPWIHKAFRYQLGLRSLDREVDRAQFVAKTPDIRIAHQIRVASGALHRSILEARLLAREEIRSIGFHHGLPCEAIIAYEKLFFNVEEKLLHEGYIINVAIGRSIHENQEEPDLGAHLKLIGYKRGPIYLQKIVEGIFGKVHPDGALHVGQVLDEARRAAITAKALLAAMCFPLTDKNASKLQRLVLRLEKVERRCRSRQGEHVDLGENLRFAVDELLEILSPK